MDIDFSQMKVGDEIELTPGTWDDCRPVYAACNEYVATVEPRPQFEFDHLGEKTRTGLDRWVVRRTR